MASSRIFITFILNTASDCGGYVGGSYVTLIGVNTANGLPDAKYPLKDTMDLDIWFRTSRDANLFKLKLAEKLSVEAASVASPVPHVNYVEPIYVLKPNSPMKVKIDLVVSKEPPFKDLNISYLMMTFNNSRANFLSFHPNDSVATLIGYITNKTAVIYPKYADLARSDPAYGARIKSKFIDEGWTLNVAEV